MVALALDRAVICFGDALQNDLANVSEKSETKAKAKRARITAAFLGTSQEQKFRDPAEAMKGPKNA